MSADAANDPSNAPTARPASTGTVALDADLPGLTGVDGEFAQRAVAEGLVSADDAQRMLQSLATLRKRGELVALATVMVTHRLLTPEQSRKILIGMDRSTLVCPNANCGARYNLRDFAARTVYTCRKCNKPLGYAGLEGDEDFEPTEAEVRKPAPPRDKRKRPGGNALTLPDVIEEQSSLLESDYEESTLLDTGRLRTLREITGDVEPEADLHADEATDLPAHNQGSGVAPGEAVRDRKASGGASGSGGRGLIDLTTDDVVAGRDSLIHALRITRGVKAEFDLPRQDVPRRMLADETSVALHRTPAHVRFGYEGELKLDPAAASRGLEQRLLMRDRDLRRLTRMRVLRRGAESTNDEHEQLLAEAQIAAQLEHPGVPAVYDVGLDDANRVYLVERMVRPAATLAELLAVRRRRLQAQLGLPPDDADDRIRTLPTDLLATFDFASTRFLFQTLLRVADVLAYAHSRGVQYRNLRPSLVSLGVDGEVTLGDWSRAHLRGRPEPDAERLIISQRLPGGRVATLDGTMIPEPAYLAPEEAGGDIEAFSPAIDVYGLGAIAYEIVAGKPLYSGRDPWTLLTAVRTGRPVPLRKLAAAARVPKAAIQLVERSLSRVPTERPANAADFRTLMRQALDPSGLLGRAEFRRGVLGTLRTWWRRLVFGKKPTTDAE